MPPGSQSRAHRVTEDIEVADLTARSAASNANNPSLIVPKRESMTRTAMSPLASFAPEHAAETWRTARTRVSRSRPR